MAYIQYNIINPRRACAARIIVVGLCVCVRSNLPPHKREIPTDSLQYRNHLNFFADFPKNASFKSYAVICSPRAAPSRDIYVRSIYTKRAIIL